MECNICPEYNEGDGTNQCMSCKTFKYITRIKPQVRVDYYPPDALDFIPNEVKWESAWDILRGMNIRDATMIVQHCLLGATYQDIADYHGMTKDGVRKRFQSIRAKL